MLSPSINIGGILCEDVKACLLCQEEGVVLYADVKDHLYGIEGAWSYLRCPICGLIWLHPRPIQEDIGKIYKKYYTHESFNSDRAGAHFWDSLRMDVRNGILATYYGYNNLKVSKWAKFLGLFLSHLQFIKMRIGWHVMWIGGRSKGRLLDIGCGNGFYLSTMKSMGWDVFGIEPDPDAARVARGRDDLDVFTGSIHEANLPSSSFNAITMRHVIEHVTNPNEVFEECHRLLKPGGRLVLATPNVWSLGHRVFKKSWRGLEPPRHFYLFSPVTLKLSFQRSGFKVNRIRTMATGAKYAYMMSRLQQQNRLILRDKQQIRARRSKVKENLFYCGEQSLATVFPWGEEVLVIGSRNEIRGRLKDGTNR